MTSSPFTVMIADTSCGSCGMILPSASSVFRSNFLRSWLSLPKSSQVNASKRVVLPLPLRPKMSVTLSSKLTESSLMPLKFTSERDLMMISFFILRYYYSLLIAMCVAALLLISALVGMRSDSCHSSISDFLKNVRLPCL